VCLHHRLVVTSSVQSLQRLWLRGHSKDWWAPCLQFEWMRRYQLESSMILHSNLSQLFWLGHCCLFIGYRVQSVDRKMTLGKLCCWWQSPMCRHTLQSPDSICHHSTRWRSSILWWVSHLLPVPPNQLWSGHWIQLWLGQQVLQAQSHTVARTTERMRCSRKSCEIILWKCMWHQVLSLLTCTGLLEVQYHRFGKHYFGPLAKLCSPGCNRHRCRGRHSTIYPKLSMCGLQAPQRYLRERQG